MIHYRPDLVECSRKQIDGRRARLTLTSEAVHSVLYVVVELSRGASVSCHGVPLGIRNTLPAEAPIAYCGKM